MTSQEQNLIGIIHEKETQIKKQQHTIILLQHQLNILQRRNYSSVETQTEERVETRAIEIIHNTITEIKSLIEKDIITEIPDQGLSFIVKSLLALHHKHNLLVEANQKLVLQNKEFIKENLLLLKRKKIVQDDLNTISVLLQHKKEQLETEKSEIDILQKHHIEKYLGEYLVKEKERQENASLMAVERFKQSTPKIKVETKDNTKFKGNLNVTQRLTIGGMNCLALSPKNK
ncbi:hypothetical protein HDV06_003991 [Boothiomyces sp. JEL0866]|nr:hypothetical protein HDV06_003991 [Boothiomyces sp. JEL0866]